jgi:hypothetical protein
VLISLLLLLHHHKHLLLLQKLFKLFFTKLVQVFLTEVRYLKKLLLLQFRLKCPWAVSLLIGIELILVLLHSLLVLLLLLLLLHHHHLLLLLQHHLLLCGQFLFHCWVVIVTLGHRLFLLQRLGPLLVAAFAQGRRPLVQVDGALVRRWGWRLLGVRTRLRTA